MRRRIFTVLAVVLICAAGLGGCKKHVGTPEDNAASGEESEENREAAREEKKLIGFSVIDMKNI